MNPLIWFFFERPVGKKSYQELEQQFATLGRKLAQRLSIATDSAKNRQQLAHIIGIERWAQKRLRVALGDPFIQDESDQYLPSAENWGNLCQQFDQCRQETLAIIQALAKNNVRPETTVKHNQFGLISVRGWLGYMSTHAHLEGKRITTK